MDDELVVEDCVIGLGWLRQLEGLILTFPLTCRSGTKGLLASSEFTLSIGSEWIDRSSEECWLSSMTSKVTEVSSEDSEESGGDGNAKVKNINQCW